MTEPLTLAQRLSHYGLTLEENVVICDRRVLDEAAAELTRLRDVIKALTAERDKALRRYDERNKVAIERAGKATAAEAERDRLAAEVERLREALRGDWHGVFLDGRNEHGSHVLMLPQRSINMEQDSNGDFLKPYAETILRAAKAIGFEVGDAVIATFDLCLDDGFFSHYEFVDVSADLTAVFYGTPGEQSTARAALAGKD